MVKRILWILLFVLALYLLYVAYMRYRGANGVDSGIIHSDDVAQTMPADDALPAKPRTVTPQPAPQVQQASTAMAPATDSIAANPANGATFSGTGKFQVYRQGNLTWRVDTESGQSCILFATMEEWKKPIVFSHGCNNR